MAIYSNLTIDQGSTFTVTIDVTDASDNVLNLTGYSVAGQMRKTFDSTAFTAFTATVQSAASGKVKITLTAAQTNALVSGRYVYDVEITSNEGIVTRVVEGQIEVTPGVTR
jgi:hypothetical protein